MTLEQERERIRKNGGFLGIMHRPEDNPEAMDKIKQAAARHREKHKS